MKGLNLSGSIANMQVMSLPVYREVDELGAEGRFSHLVCFVCCHIVFSFLSNYAVAMACIAPIFLMSI
jgi:hypothetical protein